VHLLTAAYSLQHLRATPVMNGHLVRFYEAARLPRFEG
jgi:hypothetical protein